MEVIPFTPTDASRVRDFHAVAEQVYAHDPLWAPGSEAAFETMLAGAEGMPLQLLLCEHRGTPVARLVALLRPGAVDANGSPLGYVGLFESLESHPQAVRLLLEHAEQFLREHGAQRVQAPRLDNNLMGLVIGGERMPQTVLTPHNPPYYVELLQAQGYRLHERLVTYIFDRSSAVDFRFPLPGIRTRPFDRQRLEDEIHIFHELRHAIFRDHPGWLPSPLEQDRHMVFGLLPMVDDDLIIIAEDARARPIGLLICLPDVYQADRGQPIDNARLISIGAVPGMTQKGIGVAMGLHLMRNLLAKGYQTLEGSWIRESNIAPRNLAKRFKGRPGRTFGLFEKALVRDTN